MTIEWKNITDPEELFRLKREGWEIETNTPTDGYPWKAWLGEQWNSFHIYRARPRQPVMKEVKMECFLIDRELRWRDEGLSILGDWIRQPHLDLIAKVPE